MADVCLVTGAGGFVGRALCPFLREAGYAVRGLDRQFEAGAPQGLHVFQGDICDTELLEKGCRGARFLFHLAALLPQRKAPAGEMRRVNVEGTRRVLAAARAAGVQRLILLSSAEVYGVPQRIPCPEEAPLRPIGEYGRNKVAAERLAAEAMTAGLEAVILRPPTIVGPGMPEPFLLSLLSALRRGRPLFVPTGPIRFQMVALSDVVVACGLAARNRGAAGGTFNLGSEGVPTLSEMASRLRDAVGSKSNIVPVPPLLAGAFFRLLLALGRSPLEPEHVPIALSDYVFDISRAKAVLGWQPQQGNVQMLEEVYWQLAAAS